MSIAEQTSLLNVEALSRQIKSYGWRKDHPDQRDHLLGLTLSAAPLKDKLSLRSGFPNPYDQGALGSCTANAIAAALEYDERKQKQVNSETPSRLFIYYNERVIEGSVPYDAGAEIRDGIKSVAHVGAPPESKWPYDISKFADKPPTQLYVDAHKHKAVRYARVTQTAFALQSALAQGYPVVFGFTVYDSFESSEVARTGRVPVPAPNEGVRGGHAVIAVGYDTTLDPGHLLFEVRNSWGSQWGDGGYFWMPASYLLDPNLASDFWTIRKVS